MREELRVQHCEGHGAPESSQDIYTHVRSVMYFVSLFAAFSIIKRAINMRVKKFAFR